MLWPRSWGLSAMCPLWPRLQTHVRQVPLCVCLGRAPKPCSPCVRLGLWQRPTACMGRAPKPCPCPPCACPPSVRFGRATPPNLVRHVCVLCVLWLPPQTCRHVSGAHLALYPSCVRFGRASKRRVSHVALCVRHVSAPCVFFVLSLSARCSLFIRPLSFFWPGLWFGFGRAFVNSVSSLWFLRLCLFCVCCCRP